MPDGIAVCIHDFGVVHYAGHAIGVRNIFGGVKVVHRAVQRGIAVGGAAAHIPHGIKVNLGDADFAQSAVIFHNAVCGRDCVAVLIGRLAAIVGVISTAGILGSVVDGNGSFYACTGDKFGAAFVGSGNVGIIVSVVQPDYRIVAVLGDFDIVTALAQRSISRARVVDIRPITEVSVRCFGFHEDKLARITLGVVESVAHGIRGCIGRTVDDCIAAISLTLHAVGVVAPGGLVFAGHHIPLIDLILGIGCDLVAGFAVGFLEVDLQTPLVIFHDVVIVGVCGYRNRLATAVRAPVLAESIRYRDFFIAELDATQLRFGRCNSIVDSALSLILQFRNGGVAGTVGGRIGSLLRGERTNLSVASAGGLSHRIVQAPACGCVAAVLLIVVIGGMTAGGHSLLSGRTDRPATAVNAA